MFSKIKEPCQRTYPKPHILCMFLHESPWFLEKKFKNPKLEVLLSLNIMGKKSEDFTFKQLIKSQKRMMFFEFLKF
jgi:hypothetical protein